MLQSMVLNPRYFAALSVPAPAYLLDPYPFVSHFYLFLVSSRVSVSLGCLNMIVILVPMRQSCCCFSFSVSLSLSLSLWLEKAFQFIRCFAGILYPLPSVSFSGFVSFHLVLNVLSLFKLLDWCVVFVSRLTSVPPTYKCKRSTNDKSDGLVKDIM